MQGAPQSNREFLQQYKEYPCFTLNMHYLLPLDAATIVGVYLSKTSSAIFMFENKQCLSNDTQHRF